MRKLVLFMHVSLDGFVAGPNGEMDWIHVDDEIFDYVGKHVSETDTALYGRKTYEMMESYWPTAGDQPGASKHDIEHSQWYKKATKIVLSKTLKGKQLPNTIIISEDHVSKLNEIKKQGDKDILIFGSPTAAHSLMQANLIDGYWLFINPILVGQGIPLFKNVVQKTKLTLKENTKFASGVMCVNYTRA
jgi:dihydrofolate reductase